MDYLAHENRAAARFFAKVGLDDIIERGGPPETANPVGSDLRAATGQPRRSLG